MPTRKTASTRRRTPRATPLPSILDLSTVDDFKAFCQDRLASDGDVRIDVRPVETITTPCVQVLLAMAKSLAADGRALRVTGESACLEQAFRDLGLTDHFRDWSTVS